MSQTIRWNVSNVAGQTAKLFAVDRTTLVESKVGALKANRASEYSAAFDTSLVGEFPIEIVRTSDGFCLASLFVKLTGPGGTSDCFDRVGLTTEASGSLSVNVLPLVATVNEGPLPPTCLVGYRKAAATHRITIADANGQPVDLSGKTLTFVVSNLKDVELFHSTAVTVAGDDGNQVTIEIEASLHDLPAGIYRHGLWEGDKLWARGDYSIEPVGGPHVA